MKYLILLLFLLLIDTDSIAQGLGMSYDEVLEAREGDEVKKGVEHGTVFLLYKCDANQACKTTTYYFNTDSIITLVIDFFDIKKLDLIIEHLGLIAEKKADNVWHEYKTRSIITLLLDKKKRKIELLYTPLN